MNSCFLYKITNLVNGKLYIGITSRPETRRKEHLYSKHGNKVSIIKQAVLKYGPENFKFEVLCEGTREYIVDLEMKAIEAYGTIQNGYNIRAGGSDQGSGHKIKNKKNDIPIFVTGFWFPNRRTCLEKLQIDPKTIYSWRDAGTLGDVQHLSKDSVIRDPVYVGGFWFSNLTIACLSLNQKKLTLVKRIREGYIEQKNNVSFKTGSDNHMTGRVGFAHHRSKAIEIDGVVYGSISQAAVSTGLTKKMIYTRLKNNTPGFARVNKEE